MTATDTPRTDALELAIGMQPRDRILYSDLRTMAELARDLERENTMLRAALDDCLRDSTSIDHPELALLSMQRRIRAALAKATEA